MAIISNIGLLLKEHRNKLGITQKDLAGKFISRNHLSEIENNNVALTPKNALHLCYQLQYFSILKRTKIPFLFDDIIEGSEFITEYHFLKDAMECNDSILFAIDNKIQLDNCSSIKKTYHKINHNLLRACLYNNLGDYLGTRSIKEQLDSYLKSFDAIRIENETSMLYDLFKKITPLMFKLALYDEFISLANSFIYELKLKNLPIHSTTFLNLSLAYARSSELVDALDCIDQYLINDDYTSPNYPKGLLTKANLYSSLKKFDIAKDLYIQSSTIFLERKDYASYYLTLSNLIDLLIEQGSIADAPNAIDSISDSVKYYINDLEVKIAKNTIDPIDLAKIYTNIAKGYTFLGQYETAMSYYENGFKMDLKSGSITHYFRAIEISIPCYLKVDKLEYLYETYIKYEHLPTIDWSKQLKVIYEEVLIKVGINLTNSNCCILQEIFKSLIIIKDYGKLV